MSEQTKVIISRHWNNPEITVYVDSEKIEVQMSIENFCKAIVAEVSHPAFTLTRAELEKNVLKVVTTVLEKAKQATVNF